MAKKCVRYTLNVDGTIPAEISDGGYLGKKNSNASPQDWDLIGITVDDTAYTGLEEYTTLEALTTYVSAMGPWKDVDDQGNEITISDADVAQIYWNKL